MTPSPNKLGLSGTNYVCNGTPVFFIVDNSMTSIGDQSKTRFPTVTYIAVAFVAVIVVLVVSLLLLRRQGKTNVIEANSFALLS